LEDLLLACQQLRAGNDIQLPPKTSSVKTWAERINIYARHHDLECESSYWCKQLRPPEKPLAGDKETCPTPALEVNQAKQRLFLSRTSTDALTTQVKNQLQVEIHQLVLWCLADTFHDWSGLDALVFNTCGHGRDKVFDDISLMRTVGELNTVFPMRLKLPLVDGLQSIIMAYQNIPARGRHYGMLRYLLQQPAITALPEPQIFFNYVSRIDTELPEGVAQLLPVKLIEPPLGVNTTAPENKACYTLYLEAGIIDDQLFISASYDKRQFSNTRVQALTHALVDRLESLCADSTAVDRMQYGSSAV